MSGSFKMKYNNSAFPFKSPLKSPRGNPPTHDHPHIEEFITHGKDTISEAQFDAHVEGIRSGEIKVDETKKLIKHKIIGGKGKSK